MSPPEATMDVGAGGGGDAAADNASRTPTADTGRSATESKAIPALVDRTLQHAWMMEPSALPPLGADAGADAKRRRGAVLTAEGLENIAYHVYVPGTYTHLDNALNPVWTHLTGLLPVSLAPNMITTLGGMWCGLSYLVLWYHSPNFDGPVPDWAVLLSAWCTAAYYTLDCMDGKQARRTGASSPLGQLFDHGFDCICNMSHCASFGGYAMIGGTRWFLVLQSTLQFSFFMAQWEEYYTHVLPHSSGVWCGVTEVNYSLAIIAFVNAFIDREAFWIRPLSAVFPSAVSDMLPDSLAALELRYFVIVIWSILVALLCFLSLRRVFVHVGSNSVRFSAASKLLSPALVGISPFLLPPQYIADNTRYVSVATGLLFSMITKKMIVFSMAKMTFASIQLDVLPYFFVCVWIRYDPNLTERGAFAVIGIMCVIHAVRLVLWAKRAIRDICDRLGIWCLRIKPKVA